MNNLHQIEAEALLRELLDAGLAVLPSEVDKATTIIQSAIEKARQPLEAKLAILLPNEVIEIDEHGKVRTAHASEKWIKPFRCVICGRDSNEAGILHRVSRKGDTKPVIWICHDHFNYEDWMFVEDNNERIESRTTHAKDPHQIAAEAAKEIASKLSHANVTTLWIEDIIQSAIEKATDYEKRLRADAEQSVQRLLKSRAAHPTRDQWHTASEQPKPEDFEPTGQVLCLTFFESGKIHPWFGTPKNQLADADYWHPIEPPSKSRAAQAREDWVTKGVHQAVDAAIDRNTARTSEHCTCGDEIEPPSVDCPIHYPRNTGGGEPAHASEQPKEDKRDILLRYCSNPDAALNELHQKGWQIIPKAKP